MATENMELDFGNGPTFETFLKRLDEMAAEIVAAHELPERGIVVRPYVSKAKKTFGKIVTYTICTNEPAYPATKEELEDDSKRTIIPMILVVVPHGKKWKDFIRLHIKQSLADRFALPSDATVQVPSGKKDAEDADEDQEADASIGASEEKMIHVSFPMGSESVYGYIREIIEFKLANYSSAADIFGCCSQFNECSDAKKCVHPNKFYSTACSYRYRLEQGHIFYGKNRNVDTPAPKGGAHKPIPGTPGWSFVALDFETANEERVSACSLGLVKVLDGKVVDKKSFLIKPVGDYSPFNISIHHITPEMTASAPTFDEIYPLIKDDLNAYPVLSFSMFDKGVFNALAEYYHLPSTSGVEFFDVCAYSRRVMPNLPNHRLVTMSDCCCLQAFDHHEATADALQCAEVYLKLLEMPQPEIKPDGGMHFRKRSDEEVWADAFVQFVDGITEDGIIEYKESVELLSYLRTIQEHDSSLANLAKLTESVLEDGVVTPEESDMMYNCLTEFSNNLKAKILECEMHGLDCCDAFQQDVADSGYDIKIPKNFVPVLKEIPTNYKEHWEYVKAHPFKTLASATVVITCDGADLPRPMAEDIVVSLGGKLKEGPPSRTTDFCVVLGPAVEGGLTGKAMRAYELQQQGSPIRIIHVQEFLDLVKASIAESAA